MEKGYHEDNLTQSLLKKRQIINVAAGREPADLVLKNATYVNVFSGRLGHGDIALTHGVIAGIGHYSGVAERDCANKIILPGLLDAHIHLESSLVSPQEFVKAVLPHGTTTVIADPHEIANVMGCTGIDYMLQATEQLPVDIFFMLPSCVPATPLDEAGAVLDYKALESYYHNCRICGLGEIMDFAGVISGQDQVIKKIISVQNRHKVMDGHAPALAGNALNAYVAAGIYSDHECYNLDEAISKLKRGQFIMIREGTAAKNLKALIPLLKDPHYAERCMFCTDDKHPNDLLINGHIDFIIKKSIKFGIEPIIAIKAATYNAARYFGLTNRGAIAPGYIADIVVINDFNRFDIEQVYKSGHTAVDNGTIKGFSEPVIDQQILRQVYSTFQVPHIEAKVFKTHQYLGLIQMIENEITTSNAGDTDHIDVTNDILKIAVVERHYGTHHIGVGFLKGYGLRAGAVATSIAHDSHNIIVVGTNEEDMAAAVQHVVKLNGGIVVWKAGKAVSEVALPIAGIMSNEPLEVVNQRLEAAKHSAYELGVSRTVDPFMTLSFMALPVIPELRITTNGVYDVINNQYIQPHI